MIGVIDYGSGNFSSVYNALKTGAIVKKPCAECGINEHITAHHEDYTKPLDIIWLCKSCHQQLHGRRKRNV